jgi:hypothetical protein
MNITTENKDYTTLLADVETEILKTEGDLATRDLELNNPALTRPEKETAIARRDTASSHLQTQCQLRALYRKQQLDLSRGIQSTFDKEQTANQKAVALVKRQQMDGYTKDVAALTAKWELNNPPDMVVRDTTSPIPSFLIVAQQYYVAYHIDYGVLIAVALNERKANKMDLWIPYRLLNNKRANTFEERGSLTFRNLPRSEYEKILAAKPSFATIQLAYQMTVQQQSVDNIIGRMNLPLATVVF